MSTLLSTQRNIEKKMKEWTRIHEGTRRNFGE